MGQYRLTARLGAGGMGVVYLGVGPDGSLVAVKVLRPELADEPEFRRRFGREVAVLTRVEGFCTARVIEADTQSERPFMVTEYIDGPSLAEHIDQYGCLNADMLYGLATGLAEALTVIHAAGVIHRDLKPSNVILAADGPKVIDFGIAQALDATSVTKTGMMVGSPGFIAPEQITGRPGPAADIFVWGLTIGYAAVGHSPFGTGDTDAVFYRVLYQEPDITAVPDSLRPLVAAALSKDPQDRPAAHELLDHLTAKPARPAPKAERRYDDSPTQTVLALTWAEPPREPQPDLPQPRSQHQPHPDSRVPAAGGSLLLDPESPGSRPARRKVSRRTTIGATATVIVLAAAAILVAFLLPGHSPQRHLAGNSQASGQGSIAPTTALPSYPGQDERGVFQTIARVVSSGDTMVTTGAQISDNGAQSAHNVLRQQFFVSTDGGVNWHLAPVRLPGGGQPPLGYSATRIAGGPNGWMAVGPQAIWTSRTGLSWTLAATHGIAQPGDSVNAVINTAGGFLSVGNGGHQAVIWLSSDGVTWERKTATQLGLKKASGAAPSSLAFATTQGNNTVISDGGSAWLSTDGGSAWTLVTIPVDHGAQPHISGVSFDGSGLIAVRPGLTASAAHDGVAYFSPNGHTWQYAGTIDPSGGWSPSVVKGSNYGFVVTGITAGQFVAYTSTGTGTSWRPTGSLGAVSSVWEASLVPTLGAGGNVFAVGSKNATKLSQQAILIKANMTGQVNQVQLATVPAVIVASTAVAAGEQIAVGSANGYPAIWRKASSGSWALVTPSSLISGSTGLAKLTSVTHGPAGWLAVGFPGPVVLTSTDGITWKPDHGEMVQHLAGVVSISAAAGPLGYVVVGSELKNTGSGCAADVYWSSDLTKWTEADDVNPETGSNVVLAIAAGEHGFVSVGSRDGLPIVWTSTNGRAWGTTKLRVAAGTYQGSVNQVAIHGDRVVATGIQTTRAGVTTPLTEWSTVGGTSWHLVPFGSVTPGTTITAVTETSAGFTAASQLGEAAAVWSSATGSSWTQSSVKGLTGGGTHAINALASVGSVFTGIDSVESNTGQKFATVPPSTR
jgi:serine/threonine protein kinase